MAMGPGFLTNQLWGLRSILPLLVWQEFLGFENMGEYARPPQSYTQLWLLYAT